MECTPTEKTLHLLRIRFISLNTANYIIDLLARFPAAQSGVIFYGPLENAPSGIKIVIIPSVQDFVISALPVVPLQLIDGVPLLFGSSKVEKKDGKLVVYADIIASSFFLLSRYEEILKPECRDQHGRFCAKDSIIFQRGYGSRPLVDEYGVLLRNWLREIGVAVPSEKQGFSKIYLTHDVDRPYHFERLNIALKQYVKNAVHHGKYYSHPLKIFLNEKLDENYTFEKMFMYDNHLKKTLSNKVDVESLYFLISAGSLFNRDYYNFTSQKTVRLIKTLEKSGADLGLHVSYEAGMDPKLIPGEVTQLKKNLKNYNGFSRHHYLQWREPGDVAYMGQAGITDDFTLSYADVVGFRVGTCHPYRFINPKTKHLTNVIIHPLGIMECTLDQYMNLNYEDAFEASKRIIDQIYEYGGEVVLLWHNNRFLDSYYQEKLYENILNYITEFYKKQI
jgi:hypothetical protein